MLKMFSLNFVACAAVTDTFIDDNQKNRGALFMRIMSLIKTTYIYISCIYYMRVIHRYFGWQQAHLATGHGRSQRDIPSAHLNSSSASRRHHRWIEYVDVFWLEAAPNNGGCNFVYKIYARLLL